MTEHIGPTDQLYPTTAIRTTVPSPRGELAALVARPDASSGTVLLVPGYTGSKEDFAPILDPLAAAGFTAIALDQPGQFESPGAGSEDDFRPVVLGGVIAAVVAALQSTGPVVLLGHSFGGLVVRQAVLQGATPAGLILLDSGPRALTVGARHQALLAGEPVLRQHGAAALFDAQQRAAGLDVADPDALQQFYRRRFLQTAPAALLGMGAALLVEPDLTAELAAATADRSIPVAVVAGATDDAWPLDWQAAMADTLGTTLTLVPDAAHSPAVENPDGLLAVLLPLLAEWTTTTR